MAQHCATPKFKPGMKASKVKGEDRNYMVTVGKGRKATRRRVHVDCSGRWKWLPNR